MSRVSRQDWLTRSGRRWAAVGMAALVLVWAGPVQAVAAPTLGTGPIIGASRQAVLTDFSAHGWVRRVDGDGRFVLEFFAAQDDHTLMFVHLDAHQHAVGVSILVGQDDSRFVPDHLADFLRWCRGSGKASVAVEHDEDGEGISEVDVGRDSDPASGHVKDF